MTPPARRMIGRRSLLITLIVVIALPVLVAGYTRAMRGQSGTPPEMAPASEQADRVVVDKQARVVRLERDGKIIAQYCISLGASPEGHKMREGDERTPEGRYVIDWRNPHSVAHLSLHISYPNADDRQAAAARGESPGGNIMIHGLPNGWGALGPLHHLLDWTDGCIAVTDAEMREIWSLVADGTPIEIRA